ncbi:MAG: hypothetical protein HZB55_13330 [Deltaproteobacteria bacterium]|nr:hypothetical protein [Deltaproteobacteria bacterium]
MTRLSRAVAFLLAASVAGLAWAAEEHAMTTDRPASKEFQDVKKLAGRWTGTATESDGKVSPVTVDYRVTSAGSAVEERLMAGTPHEMVDMYYDEGGGLVLMHYCAFGNRPRMVVKQAEAGRLALEMGPSPGIDVAKDQHMHSLVLEYPDADHLTQRWVSYANGAPGGTVVFALTREKEKAGQ